MKRIAFLAALTLSVAALAQTQVPITGTATIPTPVPGPQGPAGPAGPPGPAGLSPPASSIEAVLAADPAFIKALAAAMGSSSSSSGGASISSSSSSSGGSSSSSGGGTTQNCPITSGPVTVNGKVSRTSGIGPLLVFFDASGTTDSSLTGTTPFQDLAYAWDFGDGGPSGTGHWTNGNGTPTGSATGGIAAHLYRTPGKDTPYVATLRVTKGALSLACLVPVVTAYDPALVNGFPAGKSTCAGNALPVAGAGGCPAGAQVLTTGSFNTALGSAFFGSAKRVLFHCGDTFTGDGATLNGLTWSVGAYGGCEGTKVGRPIFKDTGAAGALIVGYQAGDGRIADIDFQGGGSGAAAVTTIGTNSQINYQVTLYNLNSTGNSASYGWAQGAQWGLIDSVMDGMRTSIGTFVNFNENNPSTWASTNKVGNLDYQAILGNLLDGHGNQSTNAGQEVLRLSACRLCAIVSNTVQNANAIGGIIKLHNGNTNGSLATPWSGIYTELVEISDNRLGGTSGGELLDIEPQNSNDDERLRNIIFERNLVIGSTDAWGGNLMRTSVSNETIRNNVFVMTSGGVHIYPQYAIDAGQLGIEPAPANVEIYNNTCFMQSPQDNIQGCIALNGFGGMKGPPASSVTKNNLLFAASGTHTMIASAGAGNVQSNNSANNAASPGFINKSGAFNALSDFQPTAAFTGGAAVPVYFDALGAPVGATPYLGAVHP